MSDQLPRLNHDEAAERFVETADLSQFDLAAMTAHSFEFARKSKQVNICFPDQLLEAVKARAAERGMSYQKFIRHTLETALHAKP